MPSWHAKRAFPQLLAVAREELPHSLAVTVEEVEERPDLLVLRVVVRVERDSQKGRWT